jgi:hypothetical protein
LPSGVRHNEEMQSILLQILTFICCRRQDF